MLQVVDRDHPSSLLDILSVLVHSTRSSSLLVDFAHFQNILQPIKRNLNDLVVHGLKEVTHGFNTTLRDEVPDLIGFLQTARRRVGDGPARLFLGLEVGIGENVDERRDDVAMVSIRR